MTTEVVLAGTQEVERVEGLGPSMISILIDETGSMVGLKEATINGYNSLLARTKAEFFGEDVIFNMAKFSAMQYGGSASLRIVHEDESIFNAKPISHGDYMPHGQTNLIDSCMNMIELSQRCLENTEGKPVVMVVFQTDGGENASHDYMMLELRAKIEELQPKGWKFILLGAGHNVHHLADQMNIDHDNALMYDRKGGSMETFKIVANKMVAYVKSGGVSDVGFTDDERERVGETRLLGYEK